MTINSLCHFFTAGGSSATLRLSGHLPAARHNRRAFSTFLAGLLFASASLADAQTATSGALRGILHDGSGAVIANADIAVINEGTGEQHHLRSDHSGSWFVPFLAPGSYSIELAPQGFEHTIRRHIVVTVTQTTTLEDTLKVGALTTSVEVKDTPPMVNATENSLGDVVGTEQVESLPMVTRNFTQIMDLSAGVTAGVTRADEVGRGSGGEDPTSEGAGMYVQGARASDNNFQMNGVNVNDFGGSGLGIAIPNPDTIQEFRVQTGMYDAQYGRNAGANVDLVTKSGSNKLHGSIFEFWRNDVLNANDYFFKTDDQPRPELKQNQYGGTLAGPILRDKLLYFGSWQGTRQVNAVDGRQNISTPLFTNDRSAAALGSLFAGQRGYFQNMFGGVGPAVATDGSNINPVALALLQKKLSNGNYLFPTPTNSSGMLALTQPAVFNEDQYMANLDYVQSPNNTIATRFFAAKASEISPFGNGGNLPGAPTNIRQTYLVASITDNYAIRSNLFNQLNLGYSRSINNQNPTAPFKFSDLGITSAAQNDSLPAITISGSDSIRTAPYAPYTQNTYDLEDNLSWTLNKHSLRFGGGLTHSRKSNRGQTYYGGIQFRSWADFLLGLDGYNNGTYDAVGVAFSNVYYSLELLGVLTNPTRDWEASAYAQDDYKLTDKVTLNLGVRYEWIPPFTSGNGRATNINPAMIDRNPTSSGSYAGFVVPANYTASTPTGVSHSGINSFVPGTGKQTIAPRIGFAWSLTPRTVLRTGYGIYYSSPTGNSQFESVPSLPWAYLGVWTPGYNGAASFAHPFSEPIPALNSFPFFQAYTPDTDLSYIASQQTLRPGITQEYTVNLQTQITSGLMLQLAYLGSGANHLIYSHSINQAGTASAGSPIRGETSNTYDNIAQRVPYEGFDPANFMQQESEGRSNYNALEVTVKENPWKGLQFLASYTWSKTMTTGASSVVTGTFGGGAVGDQNNLYADYGPADFSRPQRLVLSGNYKIPALHTGNKILNIVEKRWEVSGVATIQSGTPLTFTNTNSNNLWGTSQDHAYIDYSISGCKSVARSGSVKNRLSSYFNTDCFTDPPTISGTDGGTEFGNARAGMLRGPAQQNLDLSVVRGFSLAADKLHFEFRAEFFNVFNHTQFSNPDTAWDDSGTTFGEITSTSVAPRIGQLSLKMNF